MAPTIAKYSIASVGALVSAVAYAAWTRHSLYSASVFLWTSKLTMLVRARVRMRACERA